MIEFLSQSQSNIVGIRATGKVTDKDYKDFLIPKLEEALRQHKKARLLFHMDEGFEGYELGAMWDDAKFGLKHKDDFEKVAVVGGPKWIEWGIKLSAHFMKGEVRTFPANELESAWHWIKG